MKHLILVAAATLLAPAVACADDLSGAWKFEGTGPRGAATALNCTLTQTGTNITGSCINQQGATIDVSGAVTGADVDIGYDVAGGPLHVDFKGVIQPDGSIKGTVAATTTPAPFLGTKQ
jgi:hypothetical protein